MVLTVCMDRDILLFLFILKNADLGCVQSSQDRLGATQEGLRQGHYLMCL